jgi:hypothetical protein
LVGAAVRLPLLLHFRAHISSACSARSLLSLDYLGPNISPLLIAACLLAWNISSPTSLETHHCGCHPPNSTLQNLTLKPACNSAGVPSSQTPSNMAEFMFVNLNDPTQNKRREVRKLVRSHVSYMQHSQKKTELGQVQKPSKSRYTDRSVNGWAVLDEGRAGQLSQRKANAAHGLDSGLLAQHQSTLPGSDPIRSPRQLYHKELPAATKSQRRPRQTQRQPKGSPTPPTPILGDEVNAKKESPQAVSILPIVKSEVYMTSPGEVIVKQEQEQEDQRNHKWDIVSQHALRSQSLSSSSKFELGWEGVELPSTPLSFFFSNLGDPTDELRNRIEFSKMSMSSLMVSPPYLILSTSNRKG